MKLEVHAAMLELFITRNLKNVLVDTIDKFLLYVANTFALLKTLL